MEIFRPLGTIYLVIGGFTLNVPLSAYIFDYEILSRNAGHRVCACLYCSELAGIDEPRLALRRME